MKLQTIFIAALLTAAVTAQAQPRHIYRDGQYFFCPSPDYDPYCRMPNDYSWALYGPPWRQPPPVISQPVPNSLNAPHVPFAAYGQRAQYAPPIDLGSAVNRAIKNALRPRHRKPPEMSMEEEREYIIRQGEEHCRKFPQDTQVCHPPRQ